MKFKGLLAAGVVLAALAGAVYWSEKTKDTTEKKPEADGPPKILTIPEAQFKEIKLAKKGAEPVMLSKIGSQWEIVQPASLHADQDSVNSVVTALASLTSDRLIDEKPADLKTFGLSAPSEEITIGLTNNQTKVLQLGDDSPTGGTYAKVAGDPRVFTVASYVKTNLDKSPKDLRDKRLLTFNSDKLTRVELAAKGQLVEFGKNNQNEWQILKPRPLRADGSQVDDLIRKLKDAKMDTTVSDADAQKAQAAFISGTKVGTATLTDSGGAQSLEVRKDKDKNYYAKSSAVAGVFKIANDLGQGLDKSLDDFRNKKLFDFGFNDPGKLQIGTATYQKSGDKWMSGPQQMDSGSVQNAIDKLRDLSAASFGDKAAGPTIIDLTVSSPDGKRVEKAVISGQAGAFFAKREGESDVYIVDAKTVEDLQKAIAGIKAEAPKPAKKS